MTDPDEAVDVVADDWQPASNLQLGVTPQDEPEHAEARVDHHELEAPNQHWQRHRYDQCNFSEANLTNLLTTQSTFISCDFSEVDLSHSLHQRSVFVNCTFRRARLRSALFEECRLAGSIFDDADFESVTFRGGDLSGVSFENVDLGGVDMTNVVLYGANLTGADFRDATLCGADLRDVQLDRTSFVRADLSGALVGGFDPSAADFTQARVDRDQAVEFAKAFGLIVD